MKEITVTFENGGVFNGSANSFTLDNLITYYFTIDKNYRVQVNANTMAIELQEYQNTNGAWYGINTITAVSVQEVQASGDVTKEWIAQNYYNKTEVDAKISAIPASDVTKEWIAQNYYNKTEVDAKISAIPASDVTKEWIAQNYYSKPQIDQRLTAYWSKTEADGRYVLKTGDTMTGDLHIANAHIRIFNGQGLQAITLNVSTKNNGGFIRLYDGSDGKNEAIEMSGGLHNLTIQNKYNNGAGVYLDGTNGQLSLYEPATLSRFFLVQPYGVFLTGTGGDYTTWQPSGLWFQNSGKNVMTIMKNRIDLFNNGSIYLHSGAPDTDEEYAYIRQDGIRKHTVGTLGKGFDIDAGIGSIILSSSNYLGTGIRFNVPQGGYALTSNQGTVNDVDIYKSTHETFYGEEFLTTLNDWLGRLQTEIKKQSPGYQLVQTLFFNSNPFAGGTSNSGGRGGSIGSVG